MKTFTKICLIITIVFTLPYSYAQNEANVWYFGNGAGLDFNTNPPAQLQNGNAGLLTFTGEGVGSISDAAGSLLFYTNGNVIFNRNHLMMPNANLSDPLNGNGTTTQTGVIVPMPGSTTKYYVFTPSDVNNPVKYSIVDMTLDGGLGDVEVATKNTTLLANGSESAVVIPHDNSTDYWVVFHASTVNTYHVFLLTASGITGPSNYSVGGTGQATMIMKVNSCFNKIASFFYNQGRVEVVSFDNLTGTVSATGMITLSGTGAGNAFNNVEVYGGEFSPNGKYLYVSESGLNGRDDIHQFDISLATNALITASRRTHTGGGGGASGRSGAMQLGPDGKIYVPGYNTAISVIPAPDVQWATSPPTASEFEYYKYTYLSKTVGEGLPPVLKNLLTNLRIFYTNACEGTAASFSFIFGSAVSPNAGSITWDFGDGSPVVTDQLTPTHVYATAGTYTVNLSVVDICGKTRTGSVNVIVKTGPTYTTPGTGCQNQDIVITGTGTNAANYTWSSSSTGSPVLATGNTYTYNGTLPATVYVKDPTPLATYVTGHSSAAAHVSSNTGYTYFDVNTILSVTSFEVFSRGAGTATFSIRDAATLSTVYWGPYTCSPTAAGQTFVITPNVTLNPGSYAFYVSPDDLLFSKNNSSLSGNRDVTGVISILGEKNLTRGGLFYNINVALPDPCGVRAINLTENCPAPVTLLDFYGTKYSSDVHLFWDVANEINNDYFLIQRSDDGLHFQNVGKVEGRGTTNLPGTYSFIDYAAPLKPFYYRLAQTDFDGTIEYSRSILIKEGALNIDVFPNPHQSSFTVSIPSGTNAELEILDISGRVILSGIKISATQNIATYEIAAGSYILRVLLPDNIYTQKITKF